MDGLGSILIVDDEETFRESTCRLLRREGFDCHSAVDADEGVKILQGSRFDLLIADIRMPANPDLRLVQAARELDNQMPVILVTGYPSTDTAIRSVELSVVAYLTKPLKLDELLGHVKPAIAHSRNRQAMTAIRGRLQSCLVDLESAQSKPIPRAGGKDEPVSIGTIRTLAACLSELLELCARSDADGCAHNLCELLDCPQRPVCRGAIVDTIEVLKKTKETFKSKELAELRTRLEDRLGPKSGFRG
jgi:FixJ family two-component response regulator